MVENLLKEFAAKSDDEALSEVCKALTDTAREGVGMVVVNVDGIKHIPYADFYDRSIPNDQ